MVYCLYPHMPFRNGSMAHWILDIFKLLQNNFHKHFVDVTHYLPTLHKCFVVLYSHICMRESLILFPYFYKNKKFKTSCSMRGHMTLSTTTSCYGQNFWNNKGIIIIQNYSFLLLHVRIKIESLISDIDSLTYYFWFFVPVQWSRRRQCECSRHTSCR